MTLQSEVQAGYFSFKGVEPRLRGPFRTESENGVDKKASALIIVFKQFVVQ